jgi:hypothetical protein
MAHYNFPVHHGISLEEGSSIENFVIESFDDTAFIPTAVGQVWYSNVDEVFKAAYEDGTGAIAIMTFATQADLLAAVARVAALESSRVKHDGSIAFTGDINAGSHKVTNVADPVADTDATNKRYVDVLVSGLGEAINYAGTVDASVEGGFDLDSLPANGKDVGDYYKISASGSVTYVDGADTVTFTVLANDAIVKNRAGGWDKLDNTNSEVQGTAQFITVTGSTDTGFSVDVATEFKGRVTTAETNIGTVANLTTDAKVLVTAINEVKASAGSVQAELDVTQAAAGLNADGTYTAKADANYISSTTTVKGSIDQLDASLKTEETARITAVSAVQAELDASQAGAGLAVDGTYSANAMANYIKTASSLKDADEKLDAAVKTEEVARIAGDTGLDTRLTTVEAAVNGKIGDLTTLKTTDKSTLVAAINEIQVEIGEAVENNLADLHTEVKTNIVNAINEVQDELAAEETRAKAAEVVLTTAVATEKTRAEGAEATLTTNLAAEVTRATAAEGVLTTNLAAEVTRATAAEAALTASVTQEVADRQAADAALVLQLNSKQYKFESADAQLSHVVSHNLASTDLLITTQVQRPTGEWKNDVVSVEFTSANAITIEMSAARKVRVAIMKITDYTAV